jgi:hypothetical protein
MARQPKSPGIGPNACRSAGFEVRALVAVQEHNDGITINGAVDSVADTERHAF